LKEKGTEVGGPGTKKCSSDRQEPWARESPASAGLFYGEGQNRTGDTTVFSRVLYQLSYLARAREV
jgi:hypothetical protein